MSGSHSSHSTPTPSSLSCNMHLLPTTSPAVFNSHRNSDDDEHCGTGKYTNTSALPSFASVVSSSAASFSAIPVSPSSFQSHSSSTTAMSLASQQQNLYQQQQKHEHGQTPPPSAALLSNYNSIKNPASLPAPSITSSSQSNHSPSRSSSSTYDSALASPASRSFSANQSSTGSTGPDKSGSDSSDVEIYLNKLVLQDSVPRVHGMYLTYAIFALLFFGFLTKAVSLYATHLFFSFLPTFFFAHIFTYFVNFVHRCHQQEHYIFPAAVGSR